MTNFPPTLLPDRPSKVQLLVLLASPTPPVVELRGLTGTVQAVEREDGSGSSFNVRIGGEWVHVRTSD